MNIKRFLLATLAIFVFVSFYEFMVHGVLLKKIYEETPNVWRTMNDMKANMPLAMGLRFALCAWVTFVFTQIFPNGGISSGLLFGLYLGVFAGILAASSYVWLPISAELGWSWFTNAATEWLCAGLIVGFIYRR